ncbi:MAG: hypothetical protein CJBNEKGG_00755 [Prosthecobacter sp.]|nr:hypothetical protein [Prosthecobacter sp.]
MPKCCIKEGFHCLTGWCCKSDVKALAGNGNFSRAKLDGKLIIATSEAVSDGALVLPYADTSKRSKCGVIEGTRTRKISDGERQMVQHAVLG